MEEIGFLGIGRLGICLALSLEQSGFKIVCNDINARMLDLIKNKTLQSSEPSVNDMLSKSKNIRITNNDYEVFDKSLIFILVATPSLPDGSYDHSSIDEIAVNIEKYYQNTITFDKKYLVICSTVMPMYCDRLQSRLSKYNIEVNYNPEFIAQGTIIRDMNSPDMVLIGERSKEAGDLIEKVYNQFVKNSPKYCRMSALEAEITKISLNCFLTTKIAFANCIGDLVKSVGGNPHNVLSAIGSDSRIGNKYLGWGYGFGGPCFPRDNRALNFFARQHDVINNIGEATDISNKTHLTNLLSQIQEKFSKDTNILFTYVTYKPDSIILEESHQLQLAIALQKNGYTVYIKERDIVKEALQKNYPDTNFKFISSNDIIDNCVDISNYLKC